MRRAEGLELALCKGLKHLTLSLVLSLLLGAALPASAVECLSLVPDGEIETSDTESLLSYLTTLFEHQVLKLEDLISVLNQVKLGILINPLSGSRSDSNSVQSIHEKTLQELMQQELDLSKLHSGLTGFISKIGALKIEREEVSQSTVSLFREPKFNPLHPNLKRRFSYTINEGEKTLVTTQLSHSFEMMDTPVLQAHWVKLMNENPSENSKGGNQIDMTMDGKTVSLQPNNPVENVTWYSVLEYANRLSRQEGLPETYDLSKLKNFDGTRYEDGSFSVIVGLVRINAPNGNIYLAKGYRLPTWAEAHYARMFLSHKANRVGEPGFETVSFDEYPAVNVEGFPFYYLDHYFYEWTYDLPQPGKAVWFGNEIDPVFGNKEQMERGIAGDGWLTSGSTKTGFTRATISARTGSIGFRLVRTLGLEDK